jgi:hypothetical protein
VNGVPVLFGLDGAFLVTCQVPRSARPLIRPRPAGFGCGHIRRYGTELLPLSPATSFTRSTIRRRTAGRRRINTFASRSPSSLATKSSYRLGRCATGPLPLKRDVVRCGSRMCILRPAQANRTELKGGPTGAPCRLAWPPVAPRRVSGVQSRFRGCTRLRKRDDWVLTSAFPPC